ncbi:MAG: hypothetical protein JWR10_251 [Rubritepida sp.]|nr:hypothetical protein [Rubritepida sp.]
MLLRSRQARGTGVTDIIIDIGGEIFRADFEEAAAPITCARFRKLLPYDDRIIHVRWSGEACWIPMGERDLSIGFENATSYPAPGQIIVYPGGVSETEILVAYGPCCFASKAGQLAGNHFLTIREDLDRLAKVGRAVLWEGAKAIVFRSA